MRRSPFCMRSVRKYCEGKTVLCQLNNIFRKYIQNNKFVALKANSGRKEETYLNEIWYQAHSNKRNGHQYLNYFFTRQFSPKILFIIFWPQFKIVLTPRPHNLESSLKCFARLFSFFLWLGTAVFFNDRNPQQKFFNSSSIPRWLSFLF